MYSLAGTLVVQKLLQDQSVGRTNPCPVFLILIFISENLNDCLKNRFRLCITAGKNERIPYNQFWNASMRFFFIKLWLLFSANFDFSAKCAYICSKSFVYSTHVNFCIAFSKELFYAYFFQILYLYNHLFLNWTH